MIRDIIIMIHVLYIIDIFLKANKLEFEYFMYENKGL